MSAAEKRSHRAGGEPYAPGRDSLQDRVGRLESGTADAADLAEAAALQRWCNAGRLAASAAHELRGALTSAQVNLEYMRDSLVEHADKRDGSELTQAAHEAHDGIERAISAAEKPVALAQLREPAPIRVTASGAVEGAAQAIAPRLHGLFALELEGSGVRAIAMDAAALHQALVNLLLHAADTASDVRPRGRVRVTMTEREGEVRIAVACNGPRLAAVSAKPAASGLWFSLSRALVRAAGGDLLIEDGGPLGGPEITLLLHPAGDVL